MTEPNSKYVSFRAAPDPNKMKEVARKVLGETEETKEKCLEEIRMLIREHKLACISSDDCLLRFLRIKKFNTERSFELIRNYARQRIVFHKSLGELQPETVETCYRLNIFGLLPFRDAEERLICFVKPGHWNPSICTAENLLDANLLGVNYIAEDETTQITGFVVVYDMRSVPLSNFLYFVLIANRWRKFLFNCVPVRYARIHVIRGSSVITKYIHLLVFPLLPRKVRERIIFHDEGEETLFEHIPASILPEEFGGSLVPLNNDFLAEVMVDYFQKVKDERHFYEQSF